MPRTRSGLIHAGWIAALFAIAVLTPQHAGHTTSHKQAEARFLTGKLLVAKPDMPDPRFRDTVIFMAQHDETGAFGLIVNRPLGEIDFATIIENLGADATGLDGNVAVYYGGPVDPKRGFVLHSNDYPKPPLIPVDDRYSVTMSTDLLLAMANGNGPKHSILAIGYAGWGKGQLEREIERNDWVIAPSDEKILFDRKFESKWKRAYDRRYIDI